MFWNVLLAALLLLSNICPLFTEDHVVKRFLAWDRNLKVSDKVNHPLRGISAPAPVRGWVGWGYSLNPDFHSPFQPDALSATPFRGPGGVLWGLSPRRVTWWWSPKSPALLRGDSSLLQLIKNHPVLAALKSTAPVLGASWTLRPLLLRIIKLTQNGAGALLRGAPPSPHLLLFVAAV